MSERPWSVRVGEQLRELREAHGLTQQELGDRLDISRQGISELENGKSGLTLERLSKVLDVLDYEIELFIVKQDEDE
ncbi:MAG: helix-turn-helix transcriptional regulator [bacterium]